MKALWKNQVIADSNDTVVVEGNHYFPPDSVRMNFLRKSENKYTCHWKGVCDYYDILVNGEVNEDAAWIYPEPTKPARQIKGYVAFWKGVQVVK